MSIFEIWHNIYKKYAYTIPISWTGNFSSNSTPLKSNNNRNEFIKGPTYHKNKSNDKLYVFFVTASETTHLLFLGISSGLCDQSVSELIHSRIAM